MKKFRKIDLKSMNLMKGGCTNSTTISAGSIRLVKSLSHSTCIETETTIEQEIEITY